MPANQVAYSVFLFGLAGLCEIGGGWLVWQWLREAKGFSWGLAGALVLILYGIIPTFQPWHFGRVYAAYGGFFIGRRPYQPGGCLNYHVLATIIAPTSNPLNSSRFSPVLRTFSGFL
jgi:hypothetical protein